MIERANKLNRHLDRLLGIPLVRLTALLRSVGRSGARSRLSSLWEQEPSTIGIICLGAIGDLLLLSILTKALRQRFPAARIRLLVTRSNAGAAPLIPGADECASFPVRAVPQMIRFLRKNAFDVLFDTTQWARLGALLCSLSGARCTVGFDTPGQYRASGYDVRVPHQWDRHEARNFLALGQALFPELAAVPGLRMPQNPHSLASGLVQAPHRDRIYLHMWSSGSMARVKEWPAEFWAELARSLLQRGFRLFLTGSAGEAPRNEAFLRTHFPGQGGIVSIAGQTDLADLAWLLARARAVIAVNTGIMHLAALCGATTIDLHGATDPLRWGAVGGKAVSLVPRQDYSPYLNLGFESPRGIVSAMSHLPVEDVLAALERLGVESPLPE